MPAVGMLFAWFGYGLASWGYCLVKGYDISLGTWLDPIHPYNGPWPPAAQVPAGQVLPAAGDDGTAK